MSELRQRHPRVEYPAYLAYVRTQRCVVSGRAPPSDAAHLRSAAPEYGKRHTGLQEKPDDWWVLPLNREMHEAQHHHGDELGWWAAQGIADPFALAVELYEGRPAMPPPPVPRGKSAKPRRPKSERVKVGPSRPLQSRGFEPGHRPMRSANNLRKAAT